MADKEIARQTDWIFGVASCPDVCKTPLGPAKPPVPYTSFGLFMEAVRTTPTVSATSNPIITFFSRLFQSHGTEAGTAGGGPVDCRTRGPVSGGVYRDARTLPPVGRSGMTKKAEPRPKKRPSSRLPVDLKRGIEAAQDKKAVDPILLDLRSTSAFTDFFVICTGTNVRQVQAIADGIQDALKKRGLRPSLVEGYERGEWVLVDYFDFIFHIFTPATRTFYDLERLWGDAERRELSA